LMLMTIRRFALHDTDIDAVVFALIALGTGLFRGSIMVLIGMPWGLITPNTAWAQVMNSGISALVWLGLAGLVFAGRERYRRVYQSLLVQGATRQQSDSIISSNWDDHPTITNMRANVAAQLDEARGDPTPEALMKTADAIRTEIEENLRPLSHRLWFGTFDDYPHARLSQLLKDGVTTFHMPILAIITTWLIGGLIGGPMLFGPVRGIFAALISSIVLAFLLVAFRTVAQRKSNTWLSMLLLIVAGVLPVISADVVLRYMGFTSNLTFETGLIVFLPLALIAMMTMGSAIALANADRHAVIAVARRHVDHPNGGYRNAIRASTYLHNTVQSELTGLALQLRHAASSGDTQLSQDAVERAQAVIQRSFAEDFQSEQMDFATRAERIGQAWRGICDVHIDVTVTDSLDDRIRLALQAVEELIANAVRHAQATQVFAVITNEQSSISITVRTNCHWQSTEAPGMGTHFLTAISPGGIGVEFDNGWTQLKLAIG
jgi:signal transduction histidine kinase